MPTLLQLHLLVLLLASTALIGEVITVSAPVLVFWRTLIAAAGALTWAKLMGIKTIWPGRKRAAQLFGIGIIIGAHWLCFFGAIRLANISICMAGMATISLFTAFTEPLILRRRIRPFEALLGLLVVAGIILIGGTEKGSLLGLGVALLGALLAAVFPVFNRMIVQDGGDPQVMVGWEMLGACAASLLLLPLVSSAGFASLTSPTPRDYVWLAVMALVCTVLGHGFHIHLLRKITAYAGNLAMNFEPIYGIIGGAILFGEHKSLHPLFYVGALTIVAANLLHPWLERRIRNPA